MTMFNMKEIKTDKFEPKQPKYSVKGYTRMPFAIHEMTIDAPIVFVSLMT